MAAVKAVVASAGDVMRIKWMMVAGALALSAVACGDVAGEGGEDAGADAARKPASGKLQRVGIERLRDVSMRLASHEEQDKPADGVNEDLAKQFHAGLDRWDRDG